MIPAGLDFEVGARAKHPQVFLAFYTLLPTVTNLLGMEGDFVVARDPGWVERAGLVRAETVAWLEEQNQSVRRHQSPLHVRTRR